MKEQDILIIKHENNFILSNEQKNAIDKGLIQIEEGKILAHESILSELKKRHSKYFK